jgi:hypothetical protein
MKYCPCFVHFSSNLGEIWNRRCPHKFIAGSWGLWKTACLKPQSTYRWKWISVYTVHIFCLVRVKFGTRDLSIMLLRIHESFRKIGTGRLCFSYGHKCYEICACTDILLSVSPMSPPLHLYSFYLGKAWRHFISYCYSCSDSHDWAGCCYCVFLKHCITFDRNSEWLM